MKEPLVSRILLYALYAAFVAGALAVASLPFLLDFFVALVLRAAYISNAYRAFILPFLMGVGTICLWVVLEMIFMLRSIPKGPFVARNVSALYRLGVLFMALSAAFLGKCFVFFTFLTLVCAFIFLGGGLFAFTLAALIRQSMVLREENELTI